MRKHAVALYRNQPEDDASAQADTAPESIPTFRASNSCTVAEATKRWCPFVRIREYQEGRMESTAVNRSFDGEDGAARGSLCVAAGCMAWRWDIGPAWDGEERRQEPRGYCGLAGRSIPE